MRAEPAGNRECRREYRIIETAAGRRNQNRLDHWIPLVQPRRRRSAADAASVTRDYRKPGRSRQDSRRSTQSSPSCGHNLLTAGRSAEEREMSEFADAAFLLKLLVGASALGVKVRPFLSEQHRSRETTDLVLLVVTMLVTFAALMLGLLTNSVKATFDGVGNDWRSFAIALIQLDRSLRQYGGEADPARASLRAYTGAAIASTWTAEPKSSGELYPQQVSPLALPESIEILGDPLNRLESELRGLDPGDAQHRRLALTALNQYEQLMRMRWKQIEEAHTSISKPFFFILALWLVIVFASFGLIAPRNLLSCLTIALGALSIASVVFVILDLDTPVSGILTVSSQPMRDALTEMSR
jgi:hypothetical protein